MALGWRVRALRTTRPMKTESRNSGSDRLFQIRGNRTSNTSWMLETEELMLNLRSELIGVAPFGIRRAHEIERGQRIVQCATGGEPSCASQRHFAPRRQREHRFACDRSKRRRQQRAVGYAR